VCVGGTHAHAHFLIDNKTYYLL